MLSFRTVHTLAGCLLETDADAETLGWGQPVTLLLIHDRPSTVAGPQRMRELRSLEFPLRRDDMLTDAAGLPVLLHRLAVDLDSPGVPTPYQATLGTIFGLVRETAPESRLLAWAVCYDTSLREPATTALHTSLPTGGRQRQVRRVDAVDTDDRWYEVTRLRGEEHALLLVDDSPVSGDVPATYPGLVALLNAATRCGHTPAGMA